MDVDVFRSTMGFHAGTTMSVLRFPIQLRTGKNQFMRTERLKEREDNESVLDENTNSVDNETTITGRILSLLSSDEIGRRHERCR